MTQGNTCQYGLGFIRYAGAKAWNDIPHLIKHDFSLQTKITSILLKLPNELKSDLHNSTSKF